jgi:hypothetical protein
MPIPATKEKKQPSAKFRDLSAHRSTTGRAKVRLRQTKATPAMPEIQAVG